jgi:hypothetical protein
MQRRRANNRLCAAEHEIATITPYSTGPVQCLQNSCSTTELRRPALRQFTRPVVNSTGTQREAGGKGPAIAQESVGNMPKQVR